MSKGGRPFDTGASAEIDLRAIPPASGQWHDYVAGTAWALQEAGQPVGVDHHHSVERVLEAHHRRHTRRRVGHAVAALAVVTRLFLARHLLGTQLLQTLLRAIAMVGLPFLEHLPDDLLVARETVGLEKRALVVFQPEPGHALQDGVHRLGGGTLQVGVLVGRWRLR